MHYFEISARPSPCCDSCEGVLLMQNNKDGAALIKKRIKSAIIKQFDNTKTGNFQEYIHDIE